MSNGLLRVVVDGIAKTFNMSSTTQAVALHLSNNLERVGHISPPLSN